MHTEHDLRAGLLLVPWFVLALPPSVDATMFSWPDAPVPPQAQVADVATHIVFNGLDMRAQVFSSPQTVDDVVAYYRKAWKGRVVVNKIGDALVIGHREGDYFTTVEIKPSGIGSKGDIGVVDVASTPKKVELGKGVPRPMGSKVYNDISYPDDPVPARTVALRNALSPEQNASFFRERLTGDGWKPVSENHCADGNCLLSYVRGDNKLTLVVESDGVGKSQVIINIQQP